MDPLNCWSKAVQEVIAEHSEDLKEELKEDLIKQKAAECAKNPEAIQENKNAISV